MSEELKPGALSSGVASGTIKQGDPTSFPVPEDLSNYLVRRQLLAAESKRIREIFLEEDAEVKAKQRSIVALHDRVLASLREHQALREQAAREERALRKNLESRLRVKDLLRVTERYIRRKGKRLFADLKPASLTITGSSDAIPAEVSGWYLPKLRQLDAWACWFAENDPTLDGPLRFRKDRVQVALVTSGGIGDLLKSTHLVGSISEYFSCDLTIIASQRAAGEVVAHNPYIADALIPVAKDVHEFSDHLRHLPIFDLIIVWKYYVDYIVPPGSRISDDDIQSIKDSSTALTQCLEQYCFLHGWPKFNFALSRDMTRLGLSAMKVSVATSGLPYRNPDQIPFFPSKQSLRVVAGLLKKPYVTIHHGFDVEFLPPRTRKTDYSSTKNMSPQQWREIVSLIREKGIEVIQLGVVAEEKIEGVTHCLNGQTSLEETALLIKHGLCHIDTEGGLVHLANAVHSRCVVLFGPTPVEFFGYPQNINLEPAGCKACWFVTRNWLIECPRHTSGPECMRGHSAANVADAAHSIIAQSESLSAKVIAAETRSSLTPLAETVETAQTLLGHDAANRLLLIFDDTPRDICSELSDTLLDRSDVIVCAGKTPDLEAKDRVIEYGSLLNLPRSSSTIDGAVWVSRQLESDIAPFALREIFRVLKPGGQLVFTATGKSTGLDLRRSLLAARIAFNEDETPSAPVYSCSLRKNGTWLEDVPPRSDAAFRVKDPETAQGDAHAVDPRLALLEEENKRQITLVRDTFAQWEKVMDEGRAVVDDAVQRGFGGDGWIWISNRFAEGYPTKFFMSGWHSALHYVIWSRGHKCLLMLPFPEEQSSRDYSVELQLHFTLPDTGASNPTTIGVRVDGGPIENFLLSTDDEILNVRFSTNSAKFRGVSLVEFHPGVRIGNGEREGRRGNLAMGVRRFRYRVLTH
jgi:ADP-heptose:LPS heptosyltransferase/SAM-dependent methyltransferase